MPILKQELLQEPLLKFSGYSIPIGKVSYFYSFAERNMNHYGYSCRHQGILGLHNNIRIDVWGEADINYIGRMLDAYFPQNQYKYSAGPVPEKISTN